MPSAPDFLPSYISAFMKRLIMTSPNFASGRISRLVARRRRLMSRSSLRPLRAVQRTTLATLGNALGVQHAAQDVVTHPGQVLHATATDQHHTVLLQIVPLARDVADHLVTVGQTHLGEGHNLQEHSVV